MRMKNISKSKWYKVRLNVKKKTFEILKKEYNKKSDGQKTIKSKTLHRMCKFSHLEDMINKGWTEYIKKETNMETNKKIIENKTDIKTIKEDIKLENDKNLLIPNKKESETIKNELENSIAELYDKIQKYEYSNIKILWRVETIVPYTFYSNMRNVSGVQIFTKIVHFYTIATQEEMCDLSKCKIKYPYQYTDGDIYSEDYSFTCSLSNIYQVSNNRNFIESFTDQKWETINKEDFCIKTIQKVNLPAECAMLVPFKKVKSDYIRIKVNSFPDYLGLNNDFGYPVGL